MSEFRTCSKCHESLPSEMYYTTTSPRGLTHKYGHCKKCHCRITAAYNREHRERLRPLNKAWRDADRAKSPEKFRAWEVKAKLKRYGVDLDWMERTLEMQGSACGICGRPETEKHQSGIIRGLSIDHQHESGKVRGLLCAKCNQSLHLLEVVPDWPERARSYLKQHGDE